MIAGLPGSGAARSMPIRACIGLALIAAIPFTHAGTPTCDPTTSGVPQPIAVPDAPNSREWSITCGPFVATARVHDQEISLAVLRDDLPVFNLADPIAFGLYRPLVVRVVVEQPEVTHWMMAVQGYQSFGTRLAAAAAQDAGWDSLRKRPQHGNVAAYVIDIANRGQVFDEVQQLASDGGFRVRVKSVEKVLLCPVPAKPRHEVPCGASVWFELSK